MGAADYEIADPVVAVNGSTAWSLDHVGINSTSTCDIDISRLSFMPSHVGKAQGGCASYGEVVAKGKVNSSGVGCNWGVVQYGVLAVISGNDLINIGKYDSHDYSLTWGGLGSQRLL